MLLSKKTEQCLLLQSLLLGALYCVYMFGGYKTFNVWRQMNDLVGHNPLFNLDHPYGLRYLVLWPALWVADIFNWERNTVFGLFVVFNLSLCTLVTARVQALLSHSIENRTVVWLYLFIPIFITLSFPMNGRLSYVLLGSSLLMFSYMHWLMAAARHAPIGKVLPYALLNIISLALMSVSSGCFTIGMITAIVHTFIFAAIPQKPSRIVAHIMLNLLSLTFFFFVQYIYITKNLGHYGGSIFAMMSHGSGQFLTVLNPSKYVLGSGIALITFFIALLSPYMAFFIRQNLLIITPLTLLGVSFGIGIFGYAAMIAGLTAAMVLGIHLAGALVYSERTITENIIHSYRSNFSRQIPTQRQCSLSALVAACIGLASITILPDDWKRFDEYAMEKELAGQVMYMVDGKKYVSSLSSTWVPNKVVMGPDGTLYISDHNARILRMLHDNTIEVFAGDVEKGDKDSARLDARFRNIKDIAFDKAGNLYIVDSGNSKIKKIDSNGMVATIVGSGKVGNPTNGCEALSCRLAQPNAVFVLPNQELIITHNVGVSRLATDGKLYHFLYSFDDTNREFTSPPPEHAP